MTEAFSIIGIQLTVNEQVSIYRLSPTLSAMSHNPDPSAFISSETVANYTPYHHSQGSHWQTDNEDLLVAW